MKKFISFTSLVVMVFLLAACRTGDVGDTTVSLEETKEDVVQNTVGTQEGIPTQTGEETTAATTASAEKETQPSEGAILETIPGNEQSATCDHSYNVTATKESTCKVAGTRTYTCAKCGSGYTEALALASHSYAAATCIAPSTCTVCGKTTGSPMHNWNRYNYCNDCGIKNPAPQTGAITFTANIKSDENEAVSGVTVNVFTTSATQPAGSAVTNNRGTATMTIDAHTAYKVVLSDLPEGYEAKTSYDFTATTVNITLKTLPVYDPLDHSKAKYQVGDTMADFALTDTDGNTYKLSELMQQKKLIILDFWYVTCAPCKAEFPYFEKALEQYGDDVVLLALNPMDSESSITALREEMGVTFPMIQEGIGLAQGFDVTAYPTTVFIDSSGKIRFIEKGQFPSEQAFLNKVASYL